MLYDRNIGNVNSLRPIRFRNQSTTNIFLTTLNEWKAEVSANFGVLYTLLEIKVTTPETCVSLYSRLLLRIIELRSSKCLYVQINAYLGFEVQRCQQTPDTISAYSEGVNTHSHADYCTGDECHIEIQYSTPRL